MDVAIFPNWEPKWATTSPLLFPRFHLENSAALARQEFGESNCHAGIRAGLPQNYRLTIDWNTPGLKAIIFRPTFLTIYGDPRTKDIADRLTLVSVLHCLFIVFSPKPDMSVSVAAWG